MEHYLYSVITSATIWGLYVGTRKCSGRWYQVCFHRISVVHVLRKLAACLLRSELERALKLVWFVFWQSCMCGINMYVSGRRCMMYGVCVRCHCKLLLLVRFRHVWGFPTYVLVVVPGVLSEPMFCYSSGDVIVYLWSIWYMKDLTPTGLGLTINWEPYGIKQMYLA